MYGSRDAEHLYIWFASWPAFELGNEYLDCCRSCRKSGILADANGSGEILEVIPGHDAM